MELAPQEDKAGPSNVDASFVIPEPVPNLDTTYTKPTTFTKPLKSPRRIGHRYTPLKSKRFLMKGIFEKIEYAFA